MTLDHLLTNLSPVINPGEYVFISITNSEMIAQEEIVASIIEKEGRSVIISRDYAESVGLQYQYVAAWITLEVHSALDSVGLTALVATALAEYEISCNVVAGYFHDHLFVPLDRSEKALKILHQLSQRRKI